MATFADSRGPTTINWALAIALTVATASIGLAQPVPDNPPAARTDILRAPEVHEIPQSIVYRMPRARSLGLGKLEKRPVLVDNQIGIHRLLAPETMGRGGWDTLPNGQRVWRLLIKSDEAKSMRLHLRDFHAGSGKLMVFGSADTVGTNATDPYSADGPLGTGEFWSNTVFGDEAVLEYQPASEADTLGTPPFVVDSVSHALVAIREEPRAAATLSPLASTGAPEAAAACHLDVTCYSNYSESARAVARMLFETIEGSFLCTGSLLNTRSSSLIPYFLTNNHCMTTQTIANTLETFWHYQTTSCNGPAPAVPARTTLGATLLSTQPSATLDYAFLRLPNSPPNAYYLGWSTTQSSMGSTITAIGHPRGDYKRITFSQLTSGTGLNKFSFISTGGLTEGGSSGSPWLREPGVVVGLHARGNASAFTDPCRALRDGEISGGGEWFSAIYTQISGWLEDGANCTYTASAALSNFGSGGGSSTVTVTTNAACAWTAVSNAGWITLTGTTSRSGSGSFGFTVQANTGGARTGTISVGGQTISITQQGTTGGSCNVAPISIGSTVNGTLSAACLSSQRSGAYAAPYSFSGTAGQSVIIQMSSTAVDSYLYLLGPTGVLLASDDDSGGGLNARIPRDTGSYVLPSTGTYRIEATTYNAAASGPFTLSLSSPASTCSTQTISGGQTVNGTLSASDCLSQLGSNTYADLYRFTATAGQQVSILLTSPTMDTFLTLLSPVNAVLTTDDDSAGNLNSRIPPSGYYTIPSTGTYTIEVSTYGVETGAYTVQFVLVGGCTANAIAIGATVSGDLSAADCDSTFRSAYADRFSFQGVAGQQIRLDMSSTAFDTYLYLFGPGGNVVGENDDAGASTNSRIPLTGFLTLPSTGTYTIDATSFQRTTGIYTLSLVANGPGPSSALRMVAVTPCRVADTRQGEGKTGAFGPPALNAGSTRTVPIPSGTCGIPANAQAYVLNITVVPQGPLSYLTVWPAGQSQPLVSTLNSFEGRVVANMAVVPAGTGGSINIFVTHRTDVIVDINGYFAP